MLLFLVSLTPQKCWLLFRYWKISSRESCIIFINSCVLAFVVCQWLSLATDNKQLGKLFIRNNKSRKHMLFKTISFFFVAIFLEKAFSFLLTLVVEKRVKPFNNSLNCIQLTRIFNVLWKTFYCCSHNALLMSAKSFYFFFTSSPCSPYIVWRRSIYFRFNITFNDTVHAYIIFENSNSAFKYIKYENPLLNS